MFLALGPVQLAKRFRLGVFLWWLTAFVSTQSLLGWLASDGFSGGFSGGFSACLAQEQAPEKFPSELLGWKQSPQQPVFTAGQGDAWDSHIRERGWILREGNQWRLWYTGYSDPQTGLRMLGHAVSNDGIHWRRSPKEPLDREHWIEDMMVVRDGDGYVMVAEGRDDIAHLFRSPDGLKWTRLGPLDIRLKSGKPIPPGPRGTPVLWREADTWYLFYERGDQGVWLATSQDQKVWTNVRDEPVLKRGPAEYDRHAVALNQVIKYQGRYYGIYHASDTPNWREWSTCLAISDDLIHWSKYPGNPVLKENKSSGILVPSGQRYLLYTMHDAVRRHSNSATATPQKRRSEGEQGLE